MTETVSHQCRSKGEGLPYVPAKRSEYIQVAPFDMHICTSFIPGLLPQQDIGAFTVVTFTKDGRDWISVEAIRNNPDTDEEDEQL